MVKSVGVSDVTISRRLSKEFCLKFYKSAKNPRLTPGIKAKGKSLVATERLSVGVGRRHLVIRRKASLKTLSMRRACALRHQAGAQYSAVA